ncbi:MAG TPA: 4-hydroxythreonine-4-phosphate dehydrogenase, partial [Marinobacter sp.]
MKHPVTLALTAGEPAGIGPELCLQLALIERQPGIVVVACKH